MKFRDKKVSRVFIEQGKGPYIEKYVKSIGEKYIIIDLQYSTCVTLENEIIHSVLILACEK